MQAKEKDLSQKLFLRQSCERSRSFTDRPEHFCVFVVTAPSTRRRSTPLSPSETLPKSKEGCQETAIQFSKIRGAGILLKQFPLRSIQIKFRPDSGRNDRNHHASKCTDDRPIGKAKLPCKKSLKIANTKYDNCKNRKYHQPSLPQPDRKSQKTDE